jgi:hypothetical protein
MTAVVADTHTIISSFPGSSLGTLPLEALPRVRAIQQVTDRFHLNIEPATRNFPRATLKARPNQSHRRQSL